MLFFLLVFFHDWDLLLLLLSSYSFLILCSLNENLFDVTLNLISQQVCQLHVQIVLN